mgnify:CR=1 FL=1
MDVMNNLMEAQSRLGEDSGLLELSLPRIAVIGGQSAGKSSVRVVFENARILI